MKVKLFSTRFLPVQEKYDQFDTFENELNEFIATVNVIDIKYSTAAGLCHDAQTHVNEFIEDFSALVMYEDKSENSDKPKTQSKPRTTRKKKTDEDAPKDK